MEYAQRFGNQLKEPELRGGNSFIPQLLSFIVAIVVAVVIVVVVVSVVIFVVSISFGVVVAAINNSVLFYFQVFLVFPDVLRSAESS